MRTLFVLVACLCVGCQVANTEDHPYPCIPSGPSSQCPGGWVCGIALDGGTSSCHAPLPGPYACHTSADCEGWICSQADRMCHSPDAGNYSCVDDRDCQTPFRCGLGVCVDVTQDALNVGAPLMHVGSPQQVSPLAHDQPALFELSDTYPTSLGLPGGNGRDFAFSAGSFLDVVVSLSAGLPAGPSGQLIFAPSFGIPTPVAPKAIGLLGQTVFWNDGPSLHRVDLAAGPGGLSGVSVPSGISDFVPTSFREFHSSLLAFDDRHYAFFDSGPGTARLDYEGLSASIAPAARFVDIAFSDAQELVATDQGLFVADLFQATPTWTPLQLTASFDGGQWVISNSACAALPGEPLKVVRLHPAASVSDVVAEVTTADGGLRVTSFQSNAASCSRPMDPPCPPCPAFSDQVVTVADEPNYSLIPGRPNVPAARCRRSNDQGIYEAVFEIVPPGSPLSDRGECQWSYPDGAGVPRIEPDLSISETALPAFDGFAGAHGEILFSDGPGLAFLSPVFLDRAPDSIAEFARESPFRVANTDQVGWGLEPAGYVKGLEGILFLNTVEGERRWGARYRVVNGELDIVDGRVARIEQTPPAVAVLQDPRRNPLPLHAVIAKTADGGSLMLVSEFDSFWAADVSAFAPGDDGGSVFIPPVPLQLELVPQSQIPILSLAAVNPPRAGIAEAYLLTQLQMVHAVASSATLWTSEILQSPDDPSGPVALWTDGDRARIGFASGVVYSLPTRVALSELVPNGASVSSYTQVCGTTFATAGGSIYRLTPSTTGPLATWVDIQGETGFSPLTSLIEGKLFWGENALVAFSRFGESFRFPLTDACP